MSTLCSVCDKQLPINYKKGSRLDATMLSLIERCYGFPRRHCDIQVTSYDDT